MLAINHPTYTQSTQSSSDCKQDDSDDDSSEFTTDNNTQTQWPTEWAEEEDEVSYAPSSSAMNESQPSTNIDGSQVYVSTQVLSNNLIFHSMPCNVEITVHLERTQCLVLA